MVSTNRIRKTVCLALIVVITAALVLFLRGPYISNGLKRLVLPEIEAATGNTVIAQKIYINLFPLFAEAKGLKMFDESGGRVMIVGRVKAYIDLSGILNGDLTIRRLVIKETEINTDRQHVDRIIASVDAYLSKKRDTALKVKVKVVEIRGMNAGFRDPGADAVVAMEGFQGEMVLGETQKVMASAKKIDIRKGGLPHLTFNADAGLALRDGVATIDKLVLGMSGSKLTGKGEFSDLKGVKKGMIETNVELLVDTVKKVFNLVRSGEGRLNAKGTVRYAENKIAVDINLNGKFYIETLMELLKVTEKIEGLIEVKGSVKGNLQDLRATGEARLIRGNLYDVNVDSLECKIAYADGVMKFLEGKGKLYNGHADMSASIRLPVVDYFTLDIGFSDVDSIPLFKLIGWDPGISAGKVNGILKNAGAEFDPKGWFEYRSAARGENVLHKIGDITGRYDMQGSVVFLSDLKLNTGHTTVTAHGSADVANKHLNMEGLLTTSDVTDLSLPYYRRFGGSGQFSGTISGRFDDLVIRGRLSLKRPSFDEYLSGTLDADIAYDKAKLDITKMSVKGDVDLFGLSGNIRFRKAKELFDLSEPVYDLKASLKKADAEKFVRIFYPKFRGGGRFSSDLRIAGSADNPDIAGNALLYDAPSLYSVPFDSASFDWKYAGDRLTFSKVVVNKGKSVLYADAGLDSDGNFSYKAQGSRLLLSDLVRRPIKGDAVFALRSEGHGTIDNPNISVNADIIDGILNGRPIGAGAFSATIKNKDIIARASILEEKMTMNVRGRLEGDIPWEGRIDIQPGRYDSIISAFLKDVPEDLILNMNGTVSMRGDSKHFSATSAIKRITLVMYGYSFTNEKEIKLDLSDGVLRIEKISMRGGNTSLSMEGSIALGRQYNIVLEGSTALSPFKSLSSRLGLLKGDTEFKVAITGDWDSPKVNGGVNLTNGSIGLKEYSYRLSSLSGHLSLDNDRIVLQKLSGKLGGGEVEISGIMYMKKFALKRFYVEAALKDINASVSNDFTVNFGGNILYQGTPAAQIVSGDVTINRAKYKERVEWKSWLLKAKQVEKFKAEITNFEKAELNVRIVGKDNITIDNNVARAVVSADMILRGNIYRPVLLGRLETKEGTVYFRNNEFRILQASSDFSDPNRVNPFINIAAETIVKGYKIRMNLEGQLDHFNMSLSSDPVLKEIDILALLTVGQTGGQLKGLEGGIGAGEATSFVTGKLQDVVEERLRSLTGLDRFQIDPHVSRTTGTVEPRVTVSKRLLGDKMFVTYTSSVGSTDEQIVKIEYFLGKNTSLIGVRDERGFLGGDITYRFSFK